MEITNYKPNLKDSALKATFSIYLPEVDLEIRECSWFLSNGNRWFNFPARAYMKDERRKFFSLVARKKEGALEKFSARFFEVLEQFLSKNPQFSQPVKKESSFDKEDIFNCANEGLPF